MTPEERVNGAYRALVLIQPASSADDRALATPREVLAAVSSFAGKAIEALEPLRTRVDVKVSLDLSRIPEGRLPSHHFSGLIDSDKPPRVPLRTAKLTHEERTGSRESLTLRARLEAAHECDKPRTGFEQLQRGDGDAVREWRRWVAVRP